MVIYSYEGRIRKVWQNDERWLCDVYGTKNALHNGVYEIEEDILQEAKELSKIPQILISITIEDSKIIHIEQ